MAKVVSLERGLWEDLYVPELVRGMGVALRHFFANIFGGKEIVTLRYPEEKRRYPLRFRGVHRLMKRADGSVRCEACMMCSTICPSRCITIEAGERKDKSGVEKYPVKFEIDELKCVYCGLCVEACPCDAIRMDSGIHMPPVEHRYEAILAREDLLSLGGPSVAPYPGAKDPHWREHQGATLGEVRALYGVRP